MPQQGTTLYTKSPLPPHAPVAAPTPSTVNAPVVAPVINETQVIQGIYSVTDTPQQLLDYYRLVYIQHLKQQWRQATDSADAKARALSRLRTTEAQLDAYQQRLAAQYVASYANPTHFSVEYAGYRDLANELATRFPATTVGAQVAHRNRLWLIVIVLLGVAAMAWWYLSTRK